MRFLLRKTASGMLRVSNWLFRVAYRTRVAAIPKDNRPGFVWVVRR